MEIKSSQLNRPREPWYQASVVSYLVLNLQTLQVVFIHKKCLNSTDANQAQRLINDTHPTPRRFPLPIKGLVTALPPSMCGCSDSGKLILGDLNIL
uniref:Uncharacterized protein n=1 Tax=Brassica oleracea TaxID=3712 RepID=A0A3P6GNV1_BRAOL|nr:unnamed protein product [Brassica oleracea]